MIIEAYLLKILHFSLVSPDSFRENSFIYPSHFLQTSKNSENNLKNQNITPSKSVVKVIHRLVFNKINHHFCELKKNFGLQ